MKHFLPVILAALLLLGVNVRAEEGKMLFDSLRCGICHKVDTGKSTPSLKEIARSYKEKENQLLDYLEGKAEPIINPERGGTMKRYIEKTRGLKEDERKALSGFILSHGD